MPRYYCAYCDAYLTHDSPSVRKTHNSGRKHKDAVRQFYQEWLDQQVAAAQGGPIPNLPKHMNGMLPRPPPGGFGRFGMGMSFGRGPPGGGFRPPFNGGGRGPPPSDRYDRGPPPGPPGGRGPPPGPPGGGYGGPPGGGRFDDRGRGPPPPQHGGYGRDQDQRGKDCERLLFYGMGGCNHLLMPAQAGATVAAVAVIEEAMVGS
eukprot:TRINITY_DN2544_c0_g1_i2.p1 TRINITY_DN2544_c0_g1~~TRINITY_DN2544_c0_g1_i2.p1  ORF type:complete len:204 (+),score=4.60 TRINITY_DN2544_c0_g1_i2:104-715(+)